MEEQVVNQEELAEVVLGAEEVTEVSDEVQAEVLEAELTPEVAE